MIAWNAAASYDGTGMVWLRGMGEGRGGKKEGVIIVFGGISKKTRTVAVSSGRSLTLRVLI